MPELDALPFGAHRLFLLSDQGLCDACGVRIAFSGRDGGVSEGEFASLNCASHVGDDEGSVHANRAHLLESLGAKDLPLIVPSQVHGSDIVTIAAQTPLQEAASQAKAGADAILVRDGAAAALLNFADCLPLIIVSPSGDFVVVHCGWRGTVAHIARDAALALAKDDAARPEEFNAYIGPHIRQECFEVGDDVVERFRAEFGEAPLADGSHIDLSAAVRCDLGQAGLRVERIADAGICTRCNSERYYSYRATDGRCGRHSALAFHL